MPSNNAPSSRPWLGLIFRCHNIPRNQFTPHFTFSWFMSFLFGGVTVICIQWIHLLSFIVFSCIYRANVEKIMKKKEKLGILYIYIFLKVTMLPHLVVYKRNDCCCCCCYYVKISEKIIIIYLSNNTVQRHIRYH